jgi:hypothetical protein
MAERSLGQCKAGRTPILEACISSPRMFSSAVTGSPEGDGLSARTPLLPITLADLQTISESFHAPVADGAKDSQIKRLTPATWNGLGAVSRVLGSAGSTAHSTMNVQAGNFMGATFCRELGSGQLCSMDSRLYVTVKMAEESQHVEQQLRAALDHASLQQAELSRELALARATIKRQAHALDSQAALTVSTFASIQAAGQHVNGVRAPSWHGIPSSSGPEQNCSFSSLNPDAPSWLQSRIRWHGKQAWQQFSSALERIFAWHPRQHERSHGSGGGVMSALGMLASHPLDRHGSYTVRALLTGECDGFLSRRPSDFSLCSFCFVLLVPSLSDCPLHAFLAQVCVSNYRFQTALGGLYRGHRRCFPSLFITRSPVKNGQLVPHNT